MRVRSGGPAFRRFSKLRKPRQAASPKASAVPPCLCARITQFNGRALGRRLKLESYWQPIRLTCRLRHSSERPQRPMPPGAKFLRLPCDGLNLPKWPPQGALKDSERTIYLGRIDRSRMKLLAIGGGGYAHCLGQPGSRAGYALGRLFRESNRCEEPTCAPSSHCFSLPGHSVNW